MAKRTLDFSDYKEPDFEEYTGEDPPAGKWFLGTVKSGKYLEEDDQVMFVIEIPDGDYKGWGRAIYCPFEGERKFIFQELVKALQNGKTTPVSIDWENDTAINRWLKGKPNIKFQTREYNEKIRIGKTRANLEAMPSGAKASASAPAPAPAPAQEPADDEVVELYTEDELQGMDTEELEEILTDEFEVPEDELPVKPRRDPKGEKYKAALVEEILAEQEADEDGDGGTEDGDGPADGEFDDGFEEAGPDARAEEEPDSEPEPAPRARRGRAAKAAPAPAPEPAPAARTRRTRR